MPKIIVTVTRTFEYPVEDGDPDVMTWAELSAMSDREIAEMYCDVHGDSLDGATYTVERIA